jgi:HSP20 family protein
MAWPYIGGCVIVELPGVDPATIKVVAADRVLVVAGERRRPKGSGRYRQLEIEYGPFQRRIPLDEPVDTSAASARYEQGMLTVTLPIAAEAPTTDRVTIVIRGRA